jgi:hypothetical protein
MSDDGTADSGGTQGAHTVPELTEVRRLTLPEADELARMTAVFEDLQHLLRCCEHLVAALAPPAAGPVRGQVDAALVEALWTSALLSYARCFSTSTSTSTSTPVLTRADLDALELPGDVPGFHDALLKLRDHYASPEVNPRETISVGAAESDGAPIGVAVISAPQPTVDDTTVRQLGRVAYALSGLLDARMREAQDRVLGRARELDPKDFAALPVMQLDV